ncbi:hypothetical protein XH96_35670 [Bradyrhizobium sp. CCBAU 51765]|nr:hypothetical protein XH96_35670 [Bradyrhizobium sp. CCBAU 51765]
MPGLVPGTHGLSLRAKNVDGRDRPGHDVGWAMRQRISVPLSAEAFPVRPRLRIPESHSC